MTDLASLGNSDLHSFCERIRARHGAFRGRNLELNLARGKPSPEQLELSNALLALPGPDDYRAADRGDCRNYYGDLRGLPEARALFSSMLGAPPERLVVAGNSSLAVMHDTIAWALLHGVADGAGPWAAAGPISFICPVPGYDRHFAICEAFGIRMLPMPMTGQGPDMECVERLAAEDPTVKGMWCVPKYSNPTGEIYAPAVVERLAAMPAASDFRLFWDNAYAVHHLTDRPHEIVNILEACARHGHPDRAFLFASTSKVTFAGGGLGMFASSEANVRWLLGWMGRQTIGADKLNQLRHVRFLRDEAGIAAHMAAQRRLLVPKFQAVQECFARLLGGTGVARWTEPEGGYFISLDVLDGCARRVVELAKAAGIVVTPAGATFPHGRDPDDRNIRIAPSFPPTGEVAQAAEGIALSALLAASEAILARRGAPTE